MPKLIITTDSFSGYGLDQIFAIVADSGLDGIEVSITHESYDTQDAEYLKLLSKRHNLPIVALAAPVNVSAKKVEKTVELAEKLGVNLVTILPPDFFDFDYKKWINESLSIVRKKKQIHIAVVNAPAKTVLGILPRYALNDLAELRELPDVALDTSNVLSKSQSLLEIYADLKKNIRHIHISNAKQDRDHLLLSTGNLPLESLLTRIARDEYKGAISLRINPKELGCGDRSKILINLADAKKFIEKYLAAGLEKMEDTKPETEPEPASVDTDDDAVEGKEKTAAAQ